MVVHGIPGPYALDEGDVLSVDVGVTLDGFVADSAYTFPVGEIDDGGRAAARRLPGGARRRDRAVPRRQPALATSRTRCRSVTEEAGFSVVRSLVGHGVGRSMHEDPQIPNYGEPGRGPAAPRGMVLRDRADDHRRPARVVVHDDEWSISTADGSLSAHFEHTVAITDDGPRDPHDGRGEGRSSFATMTRLGGGRASLCRLVSAQSAPVEGADSNESIHP